MHPSILLAGMVPLALGGPIITKREDISHIETVPGKWLAKLHDDALIDEALLAKVKEVAGIDLKDTSFDLNGFKGFAFTSEDNKIDLLSKIEALQSVEPAKKMRISSPLPKTKPPSVIRQLNATWGLNRISHRWNRCKNQCRGGVEDHLTGYAYDCSAGAGTFAYVIDTGVYTASNEFEGRATAGKTFVPSEGDADTVGHGTHVAGTIAGKTYGVAKKAEIISVKVFNSEGEADESIIIRAMEWVYNHAKSNGRLGKSVVNMSLGGAFAQTINDGANALAASGLFLAVAAGNDNVDASTTSPASAKMACTVGATDATDERASFSNYGPGVDVFAPGADILSAWTDGPNSSKLLSGTSMATPHVAGLAAYLLALEKPADGSKLCDRIKRLSTKGKVQNAGAGSIKAVAFNGINP